jgi:DNA repair protein RadA/Sms
VRVAEPGADLAVALAVASATCGVALPDDLVAVGEVGLGGELRQVQQCSRRLAEAARLGFTHALVPTLSPPPPAGVTALRAATVAEALARVGLAG